tara:strand:- start:989 stop:1663 length:675 start_codon:yes stop_codon:yes gene_type:complete
MVQVDELMVVLDADPTGLEEGMNRATNSTEDFVQEQQAASLATMENLARQEAMVGSLNQVTGGYGKAIGASQKLGLVNEEQFAALEKSRAAMELIAGPLEIFIALKKFAAAVETTETAAKTANTTATTAATTSTWGFNTALLANPIVIIVIAIIGLVIALVALEKKFGIVSMAVDGLTAYFKMWLSLLEKVAGSMKGLTSSAAELGDALSFGPISGVMNVLGGR